MRVEASLMGLVPLQEGTPEISFSLPSEDPARETRKRAPPETDHAGTLILDSSAPQTMRNIFVT